MKILVIFLLIISSQTFAKRLAPKVVKPVYHNGIEYSAPPFVGRNQNGGYVEAKNRKTGQRIWLKRVYKIDYEKNLEKDVQDVFIKSLKVEGDTLIVTDERGLVHKVSLKN